MDEPIQWCPRADHEGPNPLPATEFSRRKGPCKACERERMRRWRAANPETSRERERRWRETHRWSMRESSRRWRENNLEASRAARREYMRRYREANPEKAREDGRRWRAANPGAVSKYNRRYSGTARDAVFGHYSPASPPCCACCGTTGNLSIDHIGGDGADHREDAIGRSRGGTIWYWLIKQGFPPGYQVLCKPCNASKGRGEHCILDH